jgi:uncharacterized protein
MLLNELPERIQPAKLCKSAPPGGTRLAGQIFLSKLNNLSEELKAQKTQLVSVVMNFSVDKAGYCCITGEWEVDLTFICQRCLEPMTEHIRTPILVSPVESDQQAKDLPPEYEPLLVAEGEIHLSEWIAEELYLALPLAPCHRTKCGDAISE